MTKELISIFSVTFMSLVIDKRCRIIFIAEIFIKIGNDLVTIPGNGNK